MPSTFTSAGLHRPVMAAALVLAVAAGPLATAARAQADVRRGLDDRPEDRLRAERADVAALIADIDDGDTYIGDARLGLSGPDLSMLSLPIPVDREDLVNMMTLAVLDSGGLPDDDQIPRFVREMRATTREARERLGRLLEQYDQAIRRRTGETPPLDTSDQDELARQAETMTDEECIREFGRPCDRTERHFDPNDHGSVQSYLDTTWRLEVRAPGGSLTGNLRVEYIECEAADEFIGAVSCDFNGVLAIGDGASIRVQNGMYIGGELRMVLYLDGANVTLEGTLSPESGEMAGARADVVGPAADEWNLSSDGTTWRAYR